MHTAPNTSEQPDSDLTLADANELDLDAVFSRLNATAEGLSSTEVVTRRARFGPNALRSHGASRWRIFASQLRNPLLILLLAAAAVSAGTGDVTDAAIITVIVSMSVGLGFFNEYRSEQAVQALHDSMRHTTTVTRDGAPVAVDAVGIVPGDIVILRMGEFIPADMRLVAAADLEMRRIRAHRRIDADHQVDRTDRGRARTAGTRVLRVHGHDRRPLAGDLAHGRRIAGTGQGTCR